MILNTLIVAFQQTWLIEGNSGQEGSEDEANMAFCPTAPVPVKNILTRVKSDEQGAAADTPIFHICSQFHHRMKVDILIPAKGLDCRLSIRTCKKINQAVKDISLSRL